MKENFEESNKFFDAYCLRPARHHGKEIILHVIVGNDPFLVGSQMAEIMGLKIRDGIVIEI